MATVVLPEVTRALYPFKSHYLTLSDGKRMHYVDEGPEDGEVIVFVHGYPTWSFLYRAFLVYYAAQGYRTIALDLIGFGLSDKPANRRYHTFKRHVYNLIECVDALGLQDITLVMEDWGGPIGLGYAVRHEQNVRRLVIMNSWLFHDTYPGRLRPLLRLLARPVIGEVLLGVLGLSISLGIQRGTSRRMSSTVLLGYRAPFREARSRTALYQFPRLLHGPPNTPSLQLMRELELELEVLHTTPTLILWGKEDPFFSVEQSQLWKKKLPRARGPIAVPGAHFLPEDNPEALMQELDAFLAEPF